MGTRRHCKKKREQREGEKFEKKRKDVTLRRQARFRGSDLIYNARGRSSCALTMLEREKLRGKPPKEGLPERAKSLRSRYKKGSS